MVDAQFTDALAYGFNISRQAIGQPKDTSCNQRLGALITKFVLPLSVGICLFDIKHDASVVYGLRKHNHPSQAR